jgi:hypothetical protein
MANFPEISPPENNFPPPEFFLWGNLGKFFWGSDGQLRFRRTKNFEKKEEKEKTQVNQPY